MTYRAVIIGAAGYAGSTVSAILKRHPVVEVVAETYLKFDVRNVGDVRRLQEFEADIVFIAIQGSSEKYFKKFSNRKIVDLTSTYRKDERFVYGLPEISKEQKERIAQSRYVANPGCYPVASIVGLLPVMDSAHDIRVVAISSGSGAGKEDFPKPRNKDNIRAYGSIDHDHTAEIDCHLSRFSGRDISVSFTPNKDDSSPGLLATITFRYKGPAASLFDLYEDFYIDEPFVRVLDEEPDTASVRHTNCCNIYPVFNEKDIIVVRSAVDNLVGGAAGKAVQNMNLMLGLDETTGLTDLSYLKEHYRRLFPWRKNV